MAKHVLFVGAGAIGGEARRQFTKAGYQIFGVVNSRCFEGADGSKVEFTKRGLVAEIVHHIEGACSVLKPDLAVFALPSGGKDAAKTELAYLEPLWKREIKIVNAGKAALAEHYEVVAPHLGSMGILASVGGEVKILKELADTLQHGAASIVELVPNGTLSYIMSNVWSGRPLEVVIKEAVDLKFAEPGLNNGPPDLLSVFKGEAEGDVPKKLTIILNNNPVYAKLIGRVVRPADIKVVPFEKEEQILRLTAGNVRRKLIVRISTKPLPRKVEAGQPGTIESDFGGRLYVDGGFCSIPQGSPDDLWVPNCGPGNAVHITQGHSRTLSGEGAGAQATVSTLLYDAIRLCPPREGTVPHKPSRLDLVDAQAER
jgi:homoserine dehydrogenase